MARTETDKLLDKLNERRGVQYPQVGYLYFADIRGDGSNIKRVYQIINIGGGVSLAHDLNDRNPVKRCAKIRAALASA